MIGTYQTVPSEVIIPLGRKFSIARLIMPGQLRSPTVDLAHEMKAGDVPVVTLRPKLNRTGVVLPNEPDPKPAEINMADFFKGGGFNGGA